MIETAASAAGQNHQLLFAIETMADRTDTSGFEIVDFDVPQGALRDADFALVADVLRDPVKQLDQAFPTQTSQH